MKLDPYNILKLFLNVSDIEPYKYFSSFSYKVYIKKPIILLC